MLSFTFHEKFCIDKTTYPITPKEAPILDRLYMNELMRFTRHIITMKIMSPWTMYRKMKSFSFNRAWQVIWLARCLPINLIISTNNRLKLINN